MLSNYLIIAFRNLLRHKSYTLINITGLVLGLTCAILIGLHIADDISFDRFHSKRNRIARFTQSKQDSQMPANTAPAWADVLQSEVSQIEIATRFYEPWGEKLISVGESTKIYERDVRFADANIFQVFDFPFIQGNPLSALSEPGTIVLTQSAATRYFGTENPIGKILRYDNALDLKVTGVMRDLPHNSHIQFSMLGSMETVKREHKLSLPDGFKSFFWNPFKTYVLLREGVTVAEVEPLLGKIKEKYTKDIPIELRLQPLAEIHYIHENARSTIFFLLTIGVVILGLACINYTNLATARLLKRSKEVGVRKTLGASRWQIALQFWSESFLVILVAFGIAVFVAELLLPVCNALADKHLSMGGFSVLLSSIVPESLSALCVGAAAIGFVLLLSFFAGLYPAIFLSSFSPANALRSLTFSVGARVFSLRSILVVFQFSASVALVIGALVIQRQISFIHSKNLGFDREQVVLVQMRGGDDFKQRETIKDAFLNISGVKGVSISSSVPGRNDVLTRMPIEFKYLPSGDNDPNIKWLCIDEGFLPLYGIELKEGRNLNASESDEKTAFLLNESAVKKLKWERNPIGREIGYSVGEKRSNWWIEKHGEVVGVVKDFHVGSLHKDVEPLLIHIYKDFSGIISIKLPQGNPAPYLAAMEQAWRRVVPLRPFDYTFLDDDFHAVYKQEERLRSIVGVFAVFAIIVSCLGLFGLAAFAAESRTKEIGIRKVLGASEASIIGLLSKDFLILVSIAIIVATPLAYWVTRRWLQNFAYRVELSWWVFGLAGVFALVIAFLTVAGQSWRAARANPVESLRSE